MKRSNNHFNHMLMNFMAQLGGMSALIDFMLMQDGKFSEHTEKDLVNLRFAIDNLKKSLANRED